MITTIVYVHVKKENIEDFISATSKNHEASVQEPGNMRFDVLQKDDDPEFFALYEAYENEAAAAAHKSTPHYLEWRETVADMMVKPRQGVKYHAIRP